LASAIKVFECRDRLARLRQISISLPCLSSPNGTPPAPNWPVEDIPDGDVLFMRIHKAFAPNGELQPGAFRDHLAGMSVNWRKYCLSPADARRLDRNPADNGVISFQSAGHVRAIGEPKLKVVHAPDLERPDRSHTEVFGEKSAAVRAALLKIFRWEIAV